MISAVFWCFIAIIVLAPLPYGAVHEWAYSLLALLIGVLLAISGIVVAVRREGQVSWRLYAVPCGLFTAVLLWIGLQACPWVPSSWHHPLWTDARAALGDPAVGAISIDPDTTLLVLMRLATYGAVFWLALQLCRDYRRANQALWAIAMAGVGYAAYGIGVQTSGSQSILLTEKWAYQTVLTSTLVNRNHYAIYAGLGLIVSFGLLIREARRKGGGAFESSSGLLRSVESLGLPAFVLVVSCLTIASALFLSQSRGGIMFTGAATIFQIALLTWSGTIGRRSAAFMFGAILAGGIILIGISGEGILLRLMSTAGSAGRGDIHALTQDIIAAAPWTGHGAGTFSQLFQIYRGEGFDPISPSYAAAHSVYLEMAAETGVIATLLYFTAIGRIALACMSGSRTRRRGAHIPTIAGASTLLIGMHSLIDFGAQIPGIAVTFAALLGIGLAHCRPGDGDATERERQSRDR